MLVVGRLTNNSGEIQRFTDSQTECIRNCQTAAADLEYYVDRAWPGNKRKLQEFCLDKKAERGKQALRYILALKVMQMVANDYSAELAAAGMPPVVPANLDARTEALVESEIGQEYAKSLRIRATGLRIKAYNRVYKYFARVRKAADVIYRDKPESRKLFEMRG